MAFQKKYYYQFVKLKSSEVHLVELWQNTGATLTAEEVKGGVPPFTIEMPELNHKFQVVRGTGCQINLISETDMKFFGGLYHVDPQEFMVKKYTDGVLSWIGYLNSEMYSEPYDQVKNYQISVTGNDGFALMDRFSFLQIDESNYTGIKSQWEILNICLSKIGLPWAETRVALSTTFTGYSGAANSTILHETFVNCANFYDEDNKPMSLREVVESILQPYGVYIRSEDTYLYITDIHMIASNNTVTYKRFTYSTGAYVADILISNEKTISSIGYNGTGHSIEMSGGFNRQVVAYSPYPDKTIIEESIVNVEEFSTVPSSFSSKYDYYYKTLDGNTFWEIDPIYDFVLNPPTFEASFYTNEEDTNIYFRTRKFAGASQKVMYLIYQRYLNISGASVNPLSTDPTRPLRRRTKYYDGVAFLITGEMLAKTKDNPYDTTQVSKDLTGLDIHCRIKVVNKYYDQSTNSWTTTPSNFYIQTNEEQRGVIADKFVQIGRDGKGVLIIVGNISSEIVLDGNLEFEFWSEYKAYFQNSTTAVVNSDDVQEIWIKNLNFEVVNYDGSEIQDIDFEYIGNLNKLFQNEADKITLKCGTDSQFCDRGKLIKYDGTEYTDIREWTRASQTYKIEELLLNSLSSNFRQGLVTLTNMRLKSGFKLQNVLTDSFISGRKLMVKSAVINYHDDVIECALEEIKPDELTIVKS